MDTNEHEWKKPWRGLLVCSVETRLDANPGLDMSVEAAGRSACATKATVGHPLQWRD